MNPTSTIDNQEKICFFVAPIGQEESTERLYSTEVLDCIIRPVLDSFGYTKVIRGDEISQAGSITSQIIELLYKADMVIADLTYNNPNVYYELGIRHAFRKPIVQICCTDAKSGTYPFSPRDVFDIADLRTIYFDLFNPRGMRHCIDKLTGQIKLIESGHEVITPVSFSVNFDSLNKENPVESSLRQLIVVINTLSEDVKQLRDSSAPRYLGTKPSEVDPTHIRRQIPTNPLLMPATKSGYRALILDNDVYASRLSQFLMRSELNNKVIQTYSVSDSLGDAYSTAEQSEFIYIDPFVNGLQESIRFIAELLSRSPVKAITLFRSGTQWQEHWRELDMLAIPPMQLRKMLSLDKDHISDASFPQQVRNNIVAMERELSEQIQRNGYSTTGIQGSAGDQGAISNYGASGATMGFNPLQFNELVNNVADALRQQNPTPPLLPGSTGVRNEQGV